jgi:hypothetical protein
LPSSLPITPLSILEREWGEALPAAIKMICISAYHFSNIVIDFLL